MKLQTLALALLAVLLLTVPAHAQTVTFGQGNIASATQAQGFTYRLTTTPPNGTAGTPVVLASVTCTGTPPSVACTAPLPPTANGALLTGAKTTITAQDVVNGTPESLPSAPFTAGASAPGTLKITVP